MVNEAEGEASRFAAILTEYSLAPDVTRKRIFLETMEQVFSNTDLILLDDQGDGGSGVVPYLPLDQLRRSTAPTNGEAN